MRARFSFVHSVLSPGSIFASRAELHTFLVAFGLHLLILIPILLADRYYVDDWGRALHGYAKWVDDGRLLSDILMRLAGGRPPLVDFSPLPQFGAILLLSYLAVLISRKFGLRSAAVSAMAALPLGASPFFLENLSFKFDSLPMAASLFLALLPIVTSSDRAWSRCIPGILFLFGSLCSYQPSVNAFMVFSFLEFAFLQLEKAPWSQLVQKGGERILQLILSFALYRLLTIATLRGAYSMENSAMNFTSLGIAWQNWIKLWNFVLNSIWHGFQWTLVIPITAGALLMIAVGIRYIYSRAWESRLVRALLLLAVPAVPFFWLNASIIILLLLAQPPIGLCRVLVGFGALLASSLILGAAFLDRLKIPQEWICLVLAIPVYTLVMFAAVYGNSLKEQKNYEMRIAANLSNDIEKLAVDRAVDRIAIEGNAGFSPFVKHNMERFRILRSLVPIDLHSSAGGEFTRTVLKSFGVDFPLELSVDERERMTKLAKNMAASVAGRSYNLYRIDSDVLIQFISH